MIRLDGATVLLQWATGGLLFLWVTTRHRLVGLGYGWLLRLIFATMAAGAVVAARFTDGVPVREASSIGVTVATLVALAVSMQRKAAGVRGGTEEAERKKARVSSMLAASKPSDQDGNSSTRLDTGESVATASLTMRDQFGRVAKDGPKQHGEGPEFPPVLDLIAPLIGLVGLVAAGLESGGNGLLAVARTIVGALFLGAVTDAMLLGHWYLVQPGLTRRPISELNDWLIRIWPVEVGLLLVPTGMISALRGQVDDHYSGMLSWFWVACAITTVVLGFVTRAALKERFYSAVMAATGLLYLAILTAFGTDLVARAILAG
jgi:hypothetical protein